MEDCSKFEGLSWRPPTAYESSSAFEVKLVLSISPQDTKAIVEAEGRKCILIRGDLEEEAHCIEVKETGIVLLFGMTAAKFWALWFF